MGVALGLLVMGFLCIFFFSCSPISSSFLRLQIIHLIISIAYSLLSSGFYYTRIHKVCFAVVTVLG